MNNNSSVRLLLLISVLIPVCAAPVSAQRINPPGSKLFDYIRGPEADPSCGVCINAARKHFGDIRQNALAKKTGGMVFVPAGIHYLGSPIGAGDPDERPVKEVYLDAFYIDRTEVTFYDYMDFVHKTEGNHPEWLKPGGRFNIDTGAEDYYRRHRSLIASCSDCPIFGVTWENARAYCNWKKRHLPTDAQWEAAARAGSRAKYAFGDEPRLADEYSWNETNSQKTPRPVAGKKPNAYGIYDMHGNVWEWVADFYDKDYYSVRPSSNPTGPLDGDEHVIRGGSWDCDIDSTRAANRASYNNANDDIGFRCAISKREIDLMPIPEK